MNIQIAAATEEQSATVQETSRMVTQINDSAQQAAEGAERTASSSQDAIGQANGAAEVALRLARGESLDSPLIWVPFKLITPENRQQFE
ncbi:MAG: hypothetical protein WCA48_02785 [Pseudomonas gingeri]